MKVETPQILWNSDGDKGKNAPLYSVALQESGVETTDDHGAAGGGNNKYTHVLATAGNTNTINLWKVSFTGNSTNGSKAGLGGAAASPSSSIFQKSTKPLNQIDWLASLSRHDLPVNTVAFSPDGLHLVTAGEAGSIILWSVPVSKRGGGNGRHFWSTVSKENDLSVRIVSTHCEGVCDISWSADSKRFVVGTIDSNVLIYEDKNYAINEGSPETHQRDSEWQVVFRNGEHSAFVQGVSYDPLGVYIASMGSDRTVRVFPRKTPPKSKKKVLRPSSSNPNTHPNAPRMVSPPPEHQNQVARLLTETKLEIGKTKRIQRRCVHVDEVGAQIKQRLFVDESTCESFFRRLCWTTDGLYLITPCALWHQDQNDEAPSFSTYLFARHRFDEPYKVLPGLEKPSVVVRPNPVLFEMPASELEDSKENQSPMRSGGGGGGGGRLPYRSVFAVLTLDSVLVYDTHHDRPLAVARGLHYAGLTDCCWSQDGLNLMVCSTDGYVSILSFEDGELGKVYTPPLPLPTPLISSQEHNKEDETVGPGVSQQERPPVTSSMVPPEHLPTIPPCKPGQTAVLEAPPAKRAKKTRVTPTLVSAAAAAVGDNKAELGAVVSDEGTGNNHHNNIKSLTPSKRTLLAAETESVGDAVNKLTLGNQQQGIEQAITTSTVPQQTNNPVKKKKRIQPLLISSN